MWGAFEFDSIMKCVSSLSLRWWAVCLQVAGWAWRPVMMRLLDWQHHWGSWRLARYECVFFFQWGLVIALLMGWKNNGSTVTLYWWNLRKERVARLFPPPQCCFRNIEILSKSNSRYIMCLSWITSHNISLHFTHHHIAPRRHVTSVFRQENSDSCCIHVGIMPAHHPAFSTIVI